MNVSERRYLMGVDLAKAQDYTSFAVIEMTRSDDNVNYFLAGLDRIKGIEYPKIEKLIISLYEQLEHESEVSDGPHLCMDASGLGAPIRDYLKQQHMFTDRKRLYPVVFTGGEAARHNTETGNYNISKTLMVSNFLSLQQHRRFEYASDLDAIELLESEIATFKQQTTKSGNITFNAEVGEHDDLICAVMIPLIIGEWKYNNREEVTIITVPDHPIVRRYDPVSAGGDSWLAGL